MIYFANPVSADVVAAMGSGVLGMIDTPYQHKRTRVEQAHDVGAVWCADNGAYNDRWDADTWWAWLTAPRQLEARDRCHFATAPDVVADAAATLELSRRWVPRLHELGYPVAYVAQDGAEHIAPPWGTFEVLFIGGSSEWKLGPQAAELTAQARELGLGVHMGRVNSARRFHYARMIGCTSVDGTFLTFGPDVNLPRLLSWLDQLNQPTLL